MGSDYFEIIGKREEQNGKKKSEHPGYLADEKRRVVWGRPRKRRKPLNKNGPESLCLHAWRVMEGSEGGRKILEMV